METRPLTRPLRALVVNPSGVLGGAESWILSILDNCAHRIQVEVILLADGPLREEFTSRGISVTVHPVGRRGFDVLRSSGWLARQLRRRDPDVVIGNGVKAQTAVAPAAIRMGIPSVWVKHDHSYDRRLAPLLAKASTRVIATAAEVAVAAGRDDVVIIEPPRPPRPFTREESIARLRELGVPTGKNRLLLGMLGRFVPYKGIDTAIHALTHRRARAWNLVALGGDEPNRPDERARLQKLAEKLGVAHRVHLLPHTPEASRLLTGMDALAVLTRPDGPRTPGREGFGMSAMEAMVAGIPVIAADDGGPVSRRIATVDGISAGFSVTVLEADAGGDAVAGALGHLSKAATRVELGAEGQRRVADHPDALDAGATFAAVVSEAALRPGAGRTIGPPVSIVSPVLNESENIDRLVAPIAAQMDADDEYLLVDGGSTDGTVDLIEAWNARDRRIKLVRSPGGTIGHSRNLGISAARNTFIACTDAGCDPGPNWVAGFRAAAAESESGDGAELYVGVYRVAIRPDKRFEQAMAAVSWPDPYEARRQKPLRRFYGRLLGRRFSARRVDGRSVGFRKDVWKAAGGFPEHLLTAEDEAFGRAVLETGARSALTLDAEVTWRQRPSVGATFRQFRGYGRGGGASKSAKLLVRDATRVAAYGGVVALAVLGGVPGTVLVAAGAAAYLSLPISRVWRRGQSPLIVPLLPAALLLKDIAKVVGTAESLFTGGKRGSAEPRVLQEVGK